MLNIRDLKIDPASLGAKMLLVDIAPAYAYKEGGGRTPLPVTAISSPCRNMAWKNWG